jgi:hypothetical protein
MIPIPERFIFQVRPTLRDSLFPLCLISLAYHSRIFYHQVRHFHQYINVIDVGMVGTDVAVIRHEIKVGGVSHRMSRPEIQLVAVRFMGGGQNPTRTSLLVYQMGTYTSTSFARLYFLARFLCKVCSLMKRLTAVAVTAKARPARKAPLIACIYESSTSALCQPLGR